MVDKEDDKGDGFDRLRQERFEVFQRDSFCLYGVQIQPSRPFVCLSDIEEFGPTAQRQ